jgi:hypothetical protein
MTDHRVLPAARIREKARQPATFKTLKGLLGVLKVTEVGVFPKLAAHLWAAAAPAASRLFNCASVSRNICCGTGFPSHAGYI